MKVYFSCSITGGRDDQPIYKKIVDHLLDLGHEVPTAYLASQGLPESGSNISPEEVFRRDVGWVRSCDALVAEVSTPSHGVGYEIAEAVNKGKPVLCVYQDGKQVSKMITGNNEINVNIYAYQTENDLINKVSDFLTAAEDIQP